MKFNMKGALIGAVIAMGLMAAAPQASALKLLGLVIDGSGSISGAEFALQRTGYINALTALLPTDGSIAVGVWQFASGVQQEIGVTVSTVAGKAAILGAVTSMAQVGGGTNIPAGILAAQNALLGFQNNPGDKHIIDVSTDGFSSGNPLGAAQAAVAAGIDQVNCLGIGPGANCNFEWGAGSFEILANSFADFESALKTKIGKELPEAGSLMLVGLGLAGLGVAARRRKAA